MRFKSIQFQVLFIEHVPSKKVAEDVILMPLLKDDWSIQSYVAPDHMGLSVVALMKSVKIDEK
jgi:hypothetical protein